LEHDSDKIDSELSGNDSENDEANMVLRFQKRFRRQENY